MKTQGLVLLGAIVLVAIIDFNLVNRQPDGDLILVFKGYSSAATNTTRLANFELHNTSSRTVWLCYSGTEFPLRGPFLERVMPPSPKMNNAPWTNIGISIVSYFEQGVKLLPGQNLSLDYLLRPGEPTLEVGIEYYVGRFKDGNDFVASLGTRLLNSNASLKDTCAFYWETSKRHFRAPKRYEVWCPQAVCFQASIPNTAAAHAEKPMGTKDE